MKKTIKKTTLKGNPPLIASRISTSLSWRDLPLTPKAAKKLQSLKKRGAKGPNYIVLFDGPERSGKRVAACLLGKSGRKDVYRFEVPALLVNKYIGETEKNLSKIFDRATNKGWILFFDEADALFGKRSGLMKSSSGRYANQEVSYLLQRIEAHPGIVILNCNFEKKLSSAQRKQFRKVVEF